MKKKLVLLAAASVATALVLSGCSASGDGGGEGGGDASPIVVGSVNALSGAAAFPEASEAAQAVFDKVNAEGGINGHPIDYKILDDKGDPAAAAAAAREIVSSDNAVAMVGSASLLECEINGQYYEQQQILSIPGVGVDPVCFNNPNISPANTGPYTDMTLTLLYGSEVLGLERICAMLEIAGSTLPAYEAAIDKWTEVTGKELVYVDPTVPYGAADYTPYIVALKDQGCDAITVNPVEPDSIGQLKAAQAQGLTDVTWLLLTSVYSENYASAITDAGKGIYVPAEFYPFTDAESSQTKDWRDLMEANDIPLTSFSQGGFLAATYFVEVVSGIEGDITRESVTKALHEMDAIENPMVGTPYIFGTGDSHNSNSAGFPVKLLSGTNKWELAADDWLPLPQ